jgi:hypothetical protein
MKRVFYSAFVWKCTDLCKHRFGVQLLQNPSLCSSTSQMFTFISAIRKATVQTLNEKLQKTTSTRSVFFVQPEEKSFIELATLVSKLKYKNGRKIVSTTLIKDQRSNFPYI